MNVIEKTETKNTERKKYQKKTGRKKSRRKKYRTYKNVEKLDDGVNIQFIIDMYCIGL